MSKSHLCRAAMYTVKNRHSLGVASDLWAHQPFKYKIKIVHRFQFNKNSSLIVFYVSLPILILRILFFCERCRPPNLDVVGDLFMGRTNLSRSSSVSLKTRNRLTTSPRPLAPSADIQSMHRWSPNGWRSLSKSSVRLAFQGAVQLDDDRRGFKFLAGNRWSYHCQRLAPVNRHLPTPNLMGGYRHLCRGQQGRHARQCRRMAERTCWFLGGMRKDDGTGGKVGEEDVIWVHSTKWYSWSPSYIMDNHIVHLLECG